MPSHTWIYNITSIPFFLKIAIAKWSLWETPIRICFSRQCTRVTHLSLPLLPKFYVFLSSFIHPFLWCPFSRATLHSITSTLKCWTWGKYFFPSLISYLFFPSLKFAYLVTIFNFSCFDYKETIKMVLSNSEMSMKFWDSVCPCFTLILSAPRICEFNSLACDFKYFWVSSLNEDFVMFSFVQMYLFISHTLCFLNYSPLIFNFLLFSLIFLSELSSSCCICLKSFLVKIVQT